MTWLLVVVLLILFEDNHTGEDVREGSAELPGPRPRSAAQGQHCSPGFQVQLTALSVFQLVVSVLQQFLCTATQIFIIIYKNARHCVHSLTQCLSIIHLCGCPK